MTIPDSLVTPEVYLCAVLIGVLFWVIRFLCNQNKDLSGRNREQNKMIDNHLVHIDNTLKGLPCRSGDCPEETE